MELSFDPAQAVNTLLHGFVTVGGVLIGGWLAFKFGLRQLRIERALDRRLRWYESVLPALDEYLNATRVLVSMDRDRLNGNTEGRVSRDTALKFVTTAGRRLEDQLPQVRLYGSKAAVEMYQRLFRGQLEVYVSTWSQEENQTKERERLDYLEEQLDMLNAAREQIVAEMRMELGLPPLPTPREGSA